MNALPRIIFEVAQKPHAQRIPGLLHGEKAGCCRYKNVGSREKIIVGGGPLPDLW